MWNILEKEGLALPPKPIYGKIPNFKGAFKASKILAETYVFRKAKTIKIDPDSPLRHIRKIALLQGKTVVMPTPRLHKGFAIVEPNTNVLRKANFASTIRGAMVLGKIINNPYDLPEVDLFIVGCVAVSQVNGVRLGKGGGFGDLEYAILLEAGKIDSNIPIAALVHDVQVLKYPLPKDAHDVPVDLIVTPSRKTSVIKRVSRPKGIICEKLSEEHSKLTIVKKLGKC